MKRKEKNKMVRIILRLVICFCLVINLLIVLFSFLLNKNIYREYGKQILKGIVAFILMVFAMYATLALIGLSLS